MVSSLWITPLFFYSGGKDELRIISVFLALRKSKGNQHARLHSISFNDKMTRSVKRSSAYQGT